MSNNQEFNHIGEDIRTALDDAMKSMDFKGLNDVISSTVNSAVGEFRKQFTVEINNQKEWTTRQRGTRQRTQEDMAEKKQQPRESQTTALRTVKQRQVGQISNVLYTVFGGIGTFVGSVLTLVGGVISFAVTAQLIPMFCVGILLLGGSISMLSVGSVQRKRLERFRRYLKLCGNKTYCDIKQLASHVGRSYKYVVKDLKKMLQLNMLPEGHIDENATCLMLDDATYMQYLETSRVYEEKQEPESEYVDVEVREIPEENLDALAAEGKQYIEKIRTFNDAIPGEVISNKLYRLERILTEIFDALSEHPEKQPQMRKFMEYYLPTTLKLVQTYAEFESVQIQGDNITTAKQEIEQTLDTINKAFEKLLDDLFQDAAFDATTDAQVLQTLLAQEGLAEDEKFKNAGGQK